MKLIDYTEKSMVIEHPWGSFSITGETEAIKRAIDSRTSKNCPFCGFGLSTIAHFKAKIPEQEIALGIMLCRADKEIASYMDIAFKDIILLACKQCGWWRLESISLKPSPPLTHYLFPTLREFLSSSKQLPLGILWNELLKKPSILHSLDPSVFERFVCDVMKSITSEEVVHIGRSGDGGVDLFYADSSYIEKRVAFQVKRRTKDNSVEGVALVREFLGALILGGYQAGSIVTTAERFTSGAIADAGSVSEKTGGIITKIDLIDREGFLSMFEFNPKRAKEPWQHTFPDIAVGKPQFDTETITIFNHGSMIGM